MNSSHFKTLPLAPSPFMAEERTYLEGGLKNREFIVQTGNRPRNPVRNDELQTTVPIRAALVSPSTVFQ